MNARVVNVIGVAIGVAGLAFMAVQIARERDDIADALASADFGWLVVALVSGLAAMTLLGLNLLAIVRDRGLPAPRRRGLAWFFVGQLGKYVPGGIWPVVGQAELARRDGTPRSAAYWSTAMSMVATLLGALVVAAVSGLVAPAGSRLLPALIAVGLVGGFLGLAAPALREAAHGLAGRITSRELRLPEPGWMLRVVGRYLPVWVLFAGMNIFSVMALRERLDAELVVTLVYATCISWAAGFVIVGLPGGLGVREAVFVSIMTAPLGAGVAVSVAVVSRVVSIAVDLLGAGLSVPIGRTGRPPEAEPTSRYAAP
jgi:glycosyltransferase 2 family protein